MTSDPGALSPKQIANASFDTKRRGYDPAAVDKHLKAAASTVTNLEGEVVSLAAKVEALSAEVASAKKAAEVASQDPIELDEVALADRLGQDAARVLSEARAAAADRIAEADKEAQSILVKAEETYAARSQEADEEANRIRLRAGEEANLKAQEAETVAAEIVSSAQADLELARSEVFSDRESADVEAAQIIREAELARRQILGDLLRRRGAAKRQIEQLRAGRERLLASHEAVRRALDEITEELNISMSEARAAAKTAGHTVSDGTIEELEAEIETARLTGLLDTGPVPVVRSPALPTKSSANRAAASVDAAADDSAAPNQPDAGASSDPAPTDAAVDTDIETVDTDTETVDTDIETVDTKTVDTETVEASTIETVEAETTQATDATTEVAAERTNSGDLAEVVQLDKARADVDTASHPAKGREAGNGRNGSATKKSQATNDSSDASVPTAPDNNTTVEPTSPAKLVAAPDPVEPAADDSVGSLFASLRSDNAEPVVQKKSTAKKKTKTDVSSSKTSSNATKAAAPARAKTGSNKTGSKRAKPVAPLVDSSALARRLKRVLADEQSRAMSQLKNAEVLPDLEALLFSEANHRSGYWNEVLDQLDDPLLAGAEASSAIDGLVDTIRRRVAAALTAADGDTETAVGSLRSIYREIKTQQIGDTADAVSNSMLARS